jgi:hypothetical protein
LVRIFGTAEARFSKMVKKLEASSACWLNLIEGEIEGDSRAINCELVQAWIKHIGTGDVGASLKLSNGFELTHRRLMSRVIYTKYGKVCMKRLGYSLREHSIVYPLDAVLNLSSSSYSFELQRFIARRIPNMSFEEVIKLTEEITGVKVGGRQAVKIVEQCTQDFDEFYKKREDNNKDKTSIIVLTTDGKGIVMRSEGLRALTREKAKTATRKMKTRLSRGEKSNRKRMAQVASIYTIDPFTRTPEEVVNELARRQAYQRRPRPKDKRVWASVEKSSLQVIQQLFAEAKKRDSKHKKNWVVLVDGQKHQMSIIKSIIRKDKKIKATIIVDIIHVIEYLWLAARVFHKETSKECELWVEKKLDGILNGFAGKVAGSIRMSAVKLGLTPEQLKTTETAARYLANLKQFMNYREYLKLGYPIATGVIEGACRHLIKDRMDITGARWSLSGAESVLKLKSLVSSGDFDDYWNFHLKQEHYRNHLSKLADPSLLSLI